MKTKRTIPPKKLSIRTELENFVIAYNKVLKDVVSTMPILILLRNTHPSIRGDYSYRFKEIGLLTAEEIKEFTAIPKISDHKSPTLKMMKR